MRKTIVITVLLCLSFQLSAKAIWFAYFQIDKVSFIAQFCENKFNPSANCQARCYLKKQAKQESESAQKIPGFIKEKEEQVTFCHVYQPAIFYQTPVVKKWVKYLNPYQFTLIKTVFHPPGI